MELDRSISPHFFGEWVKRRRKALDLTQEELAFRARCSKSALRKIESGERKPSKQLAGLLADALEISPEEKTKFIKVARGDTSLNRLSAPVLEESYASIIDLKFPIFQSRIPLQPNPVIGREYELAAMEKLFKNPVCRLLTLTGMGGIGKTSLAIEFATRHQSSFPAGIYYVPLTSIKSSESVIPAIAEVIGFVFSGPTEPKEQLINYLSSTLNTPFLLVLDNLEHLLMQPTFKVEADIGSIVSEFLQRLPTIKILATSREHLNLLGEWTYEIHGLPIPPLELEGNLEDYSAAMVFIHHAKRVNVAFDVTGDEKTALIKICHLLDGIPLAIELASAWVGVLSCKDIAQEIESNIDFLKTSLRDIPERHRSIRASFDHSWQLLTDVEQQVLSNLSIFHGQFDRVAAQRIAMSDLEVLASLVSKSLVRRKEDDQYDLHEAIRQYAMTRLEEDSANCFKICERHCEHYLTVIANYENALKSSAQQQAVRILLYSLDNIRAAWKWAIKQKKYNALKPAVRSLGWFFELAGLYSEGIEQFELLIHALRSGKPTEQNAKLLGLAIMQKGLLHFRRGQVFPVQVIYEESLDILRPTGEKALLMEALIFLGIIEHLNGDYQRSITLLEEGLQYAQECGDVWFTAYAIYNLGYVDSMLGEYQQGYERMMTGLEIWRSIGDLHYIALGLNFLVTTLIQLGRYEEAKTSMLESIALCEQAKNRWGMGTAYRFLGLVEKADGQIQEAKKHFIKSIDIFNASAEEWHVAQTQIYLGEAEIAARNFSEAKSLFLKTLGTSINIKSIPLAMESILGLASLEFENGKSEHALELSCIVTRHPAISQEVRDRAKIMEGKCQQLLPDSKFQEICTSVNSWTMDEFVKKFKLDDIIIHSADWAEISSLLRP